MGLRPNNVVYVEYVLGNYLEKSMSSYCHMSKYLGWSLRQEIFSFDLVLKQAVYGTDVLIQRRLKYGSSVAAVFV
jgi:hypothetical protein